MFDSIDYFLFGPWLLVDFYKWIILRWSPRRDKWRPCSCELEDSHLQWWWWNSWNDMCIEAEVWNLVEIYQILADLEWVFHDCFYRGKRNASNEVMILVNRWPSILLFYNQPGEPRKSFLQAFALYIWKSMISPALKSLLRSFPFSDALTPKTVEDGRSWPQ